MTLSIIIPTVNRPTELRRLLDSFKNQQDVDEIIIVEQGSAETKKIVGEYPSLPIVYLFHSVRSLTQARNVGVRKATGDIIGFLDDDIILEKDYTKNIKNFFENHKDALGVQGVITNFEAGHTTKVGGSRLVYTIYNVLAKVFLLNNSSRKNTLQWSGRNKYASRVSSTLPCQWLSGIGNYRKAVFENHKFDEHLTGYAFGEDKLFSYPLYQKQQDSLFVDPSIRCSHEYADAGRPQKKDWVDMKINYTYYLWRVLFSKKQPLSWFAFWWANLGDCFVVFISVVLRQYPFRFLGWHIAGYWRILWKGKQVYNTIKNT